MPKRAPAITIANLTLDRASSIPLYRQLYDGLRCAILSGQLRSAARIPSTRDFATELQVSRGCVRTAIDQLIAEGYLEGTVGAGTYVARGLPDDLLQSRQREPTPRRFLKAGKILSRRGTDISKMPLPASFATGKYVAFRPNLPALDAFPYQTWAKLEARRWRNPPRELVGYGEPAGYLPFREAIASYLGTSRGVQCDAAQVVVVGGSQQALDLVARILLDPGDSVWLEDPGYLGARGAITAAGGRIIPVPLDTEGLVVAAGAKICPHARMVYVTPSHQYPMGMTMSLARRFELLRWATHSNAWILEDDYDSEYRYKGRPLGALQGLDTRGCVVYMGTFSKVLLPSLHLGYLVVPHKLVDAFLAARSIAGHAPSLDQAVLADFITEGHFGRHIRRMRTLYEERQSEFRKAARQLEVALDIPAIESGINVLGWLRPSTNDRIWSNRAALHGVAAWPLSLFSLAHEKRGGFLLGFGGFGRSETKEGLRRLAEALRELH